MANVVGRDLDKAKLAGLLDEFRVVSLTGPAGVGKSTLALAVAASCRPVVVDAQGADETELRRRVTRALARAAPDPLVVVDDVDDVAAARAAIDHLAEQAPSARFLVTSRAPLGASGERRLELDMLSRDEGVALLRTRARFGAEPSDELLAAIVELTDGLPLALVLAAGRSRVLSADELLARLDDPLRVLRGGSSPRHATLERVIASSYDALGPDERVALACASLFESAFSADGFEHVVAGAVAADPLDLLQSLFDKALLLHDRSSGPTSFRMLRGVRAFARERLRESELASEAAARHEAHVEAAARAAAHETYGPRSEAAHAELERLLPDVLAAFATSTRDRPARAAELWLSLFDPILFAGVLPLADARFERAIDAADRCGDVRLRVRTRVMRARALLEGGPPERAASDLARAAEIAREVNATSLVAEVERSRGWMELASAKPEPAAVHFEAALAMSIATHDIRGHADALAGLGLAHHMCGRKDVARDSLRLARALHESQHDSLRRHRVDDMLELVDPSADPARDAIDELRASAERHEARGQGLRLAVDLALLADLEERAGRSPEADALRLRARAAARTSGLSALETWARAAAKPSAPAAAEAQWIVGPEGRTLTAPDGTKLDLARHGSLRRVLLALVDARLERPGQALSAEAVLAAGWPGERVLHEAGLLRVYSAIRRLRRLGFAEGLVTRDDGYLLAPDLPVTRVI